MRETFIEQARPIGRSYPGRHARFDDTNQLGQQTTDHRNNGYPVEVEEVDMNNQALFQDHVETQVELHASPTEVLS